MPAVSGSPNVLVDGKPALRVGDSGVHAACCGPNSWKAAQGSAKVLMNGIPLVRQGDTTTHCGGSGNMFEGSAVLIVG